MPPYWPFSIPLFSLICLKSDFVNDFLLTEWLHQSKFEKIDFIFFRKMILISFVLTKTNFWFVLLNIS